MTKPFVAILMGSDSDLSVMQTCFDALKDLEVEFEANILSAHRTPDLASEYVLNATTRGCAVFIAAAGLAAHLAGCVAAHTIRPVIGIPLSAGDLNGLDALLATVQMPGGTPVACTSIGKAGAKNAAVLAAQILALQDNRLAERLLAQRQTKRESLIKANQKLKA
ncbi:MAG: 5-(carboxyamino)imidazole ribonucleotide mutase [Gammaproteobacteria bacterium]|nr:5-(carboxyamino)imidazole ribonucleotide mutase [Gammaproteobacteria bacterium]